MPTTRSEAVRGLLSLFEQPRYLEIGVNAGETFHAVTAKEKVAVDPHFRFDLAVAKTEKVDCTYHQVTSDEYFGSIISPDERFEVIYIDGLHTSEQTLRDFMNAISFLSPDGVILIDDVRPPTYLASIPDRKTFFKVRESLGSSKATWMGDVFRLVYFLETFAQQFSYRIVADNHGQAVVWRNRRAQVPQRTISEIGVKCFENMIMDAATFPMVPFTEILELIRTTRSSVRQVR